MSVRVNSRYEWIRGDYVGNIDEVKEIKDGFVIFKSGRRCNSEIFNEYLLPEGGSPITNDPMFKGVTTVQFEQDDSNNNGVAQYVEQPKVVKQPREIPRPQREIVPEKKVNPITLLINQSSKDECELNINYTVKLPKKSVYSLIKDSFEKIDIDNEILDTIFSEININEFKDYFKKQLLEKIKLHYKS